MVRNSLTRIRQIDAVCDLKQGIRHKGATLVPSEFAQPQHDMLGKGAKSFARYPGGQTSPF
jgi:hypothetical protein